MNSSDSDYDNDSSQNELHRNIQITAAVVHAVQSPTTQGDENQM